MRVTTIILSYRRAVLIAVYTHLLREYQPVPSDKSPRRWFADLVALGQYRAVPRRVELGAATGCGR